MTCIYFNEVKPPVEFGLPEDTTCLTLLRSKLNNILPDIKKNVSKIECRAPKIDTDGKVEYDPIELKTCKDLKVV